MLQGLRAVWREALQGSLTDGAFKEAIAGLDPVSAADALNRAGYLAWPARHSLICSACPRITKAKAAGVPKGRKPSVPAAEVCRLRDEEKLGPTEMAARLNIGRASVYRALS